jgi:hypothetical protein
MGRRDKGETGWHTQNDPDSVPMVNACGTCGGTGQQVRTRQDITTKDGHGTETIDCPKCGGTGQRK